MTSDTNRLRAWSYVRALLITLALFVQCVNALPNKRLTAKHLARPEGRRALRWLSELSSGTSEEEMQVRLIALSERALAARRLLLGPFAPLLRAAGMRQQWGLFASVNDEAYRMRIEVRESDSWQVIYRANLVDSWDLDPVLGYRRLRSIYDPRRTGISDQYVGFTRWLSQRLLREHPCYAAVRVSMEHTRPGAHELGTLYVQEQP